MQRAEVIKRGRAEHPQAAADERAVRVRYRESEIRAQALLRLLLKLPHFVFFAAEGVYAPHAAQTFLHLREQCALTFMDVSGFLANALCEKVNREHDERHHA